MSFKLDDGSGRVVSLENYATVYKEYSLDIRDEVRSMLLDGIDLTSWIETCKDNPYRLTQVRLWVKSGLPKDFLSISDGFTLFKLRNFSVSGGNLSELAPFIRSGFTSNQWDYLISWASLGVLDVRLNLNRTPYSMWKFIDSGLRKGLPMWLFTTGKLYSNVYMESVIALLLNNYDISQFLVDSEGYSDEVLRILAQNSTKKSLKRVYPYIYSFISEAFLTELLRLGQKGAPKGLLLEVCKINEVKGKQGVSFYVYHSYHLEFIYKALDKGVDYSRLLDPSLSYSKCSMILDELLLSKGRKTKGRL